MTAHPAFYAKARQNAADRTAEYRAHIQTLPRGSRHRVLEELLVLAADDTRKLTEICADAGLTHDWIYRSVRESRRSANITSLEALANALGYRVVLERIES